MCRPRTTSCAHALGAPSRSQLRPPRTRSPTRSPRQAVSSARRSQMSWVEAELREQPAALERFLAAESASASGIVRDLLREDVRYLLIVSRGSSSNVARYMKYLFGTVNLL